MKAYPGTNLPNFKNKSNVKSNGQECPFHTFKVKNKRVGDLARAPDLNSFVRSDEGNFSSESYRDMRLHLKL